MVAGAVLTAPLIAYTELVRGGWFSDLIAGNANSRRSSGVAVSSGTRPMPIRAARPPIAGQAVIIAKRTDRAGPPASSRMYGDAHGWLASTRPSQAHPTKVCGQRSCNARVKGTA